MSDLEEALTLREQDGCWRAFADPRYEAANGMYGGWTAAVALKAVMQSADRGRQPSAVTVNFIARIERGVDIDIRTRRLGGSRSVEHWLAEVSSVEGDDLLAVASVVLTSRLDSDGHTVPTPPAAPDPDALDVFHPPGAEGGRTDVRFVVGWEPFGRMDTESVAWVRELTGRAVDHLQLVFLSDQFAPRSFYWSDGFRPSATLTMTVYFHATESELEAVGDDYVLTEAVADRGAQSTNDQHGRIWSRSGILLATCEQLAWYR